MDVAQIAKDFGVHFTSLYGWMKRPGTIPGPLVSRPRMAVAKQRIRAFEQEVEVLRRAAGFPSR